MNNKNVKKNLMNQMVVLIIMAMVVTSLTGCEPFRKKFVRQKKKDDQKKLELIPILEPIEYPKVSKSAKSQYEYHYSLWKVWVSDLETALRHKESDRRVTYLFEQMVKHLELMRQWLIPEKQKVLKEHVESLDKMRKELAKPIQLRNKVSLENQLRRHGRFMRTHFSPMHIEESLRQIY